MSQCTVCSGGSRCALAREPGDSFCLRHGTLDADGLLGPAPRSVVPAAQAGAAGLAPGDAAQLPMQLNDATSAVVGRALDWVLGVGLAAPDSAAEALRLLEFAAVLAEVQGPPRQAAGWVGASAALRSQVVAGLQGSVTVGP